MARVRHKQGIAEIPNNQIATISGKYHIRKNDYAGYTFRFAWVSFNLINGKHIDITEFTSGQTLSGGNYDKVLDAFQRLLELNRYPRVDEQMSAVTNMYSSCKEFGTHQFYIDMNDPTVVKTQFVSKKLV